jgi:hypothetical protein
VFDAKDSRYSAPDKNVGPAKKFLGREIEVGKT